jgi:hypothetical protein
MALGGGLATPDGQILKKKKKKKKKKKNPFDLGGGEWDSLQNGLENIQFMVWISS